MTKSNFFFQTTFPNLFLFLLLAGIVSCNNENRKGDSINDKDSSATKNPPNGRVSANSITFTSFKLDTTTMRKYETDSNARLFLFKVKFDDLKNPASMTLWAYPAKNHKNFAEGEKHPFKLDTTGRPAFMDTKDIYVGDNEIALKYFHEGNNLNKPFKSFAYIILTPYKDANGDLIFKISPQNLIAPLLDFPAETNPVPPGKPEEN